MKNIIAVLFFVLGTLFYPRVVPAVTIDATNDDFTINWLLTTGQGAPINLSATATFDVTSITTNGSGNITSVTFNVNFSNTTTTNATTTEAGITTFGFGTNPNATTVVFSDTNDGAFAFAEVQAGEQNFPGGFKDIDVCVFTQGCSGGSQGSALAAGGSDAFTLTINFTGTHTSVDFEPFPIKFQTTQGSFEFGGGQTGGQTTGATTGQTTGQVPEPSTMLLLGSGLILLGSRMRRKK